MNKISDYDIQALIDEELNLEEKDRVETAILNDDSFTKRYEELKSQKILLQKWWKNQIQ